MGSLAAGGQGTRSGHRALQDLGVGLVPGLLLAVVGVQRGEDGHDDDEQLQEHHLPERLLVVRGLGDQGAEDPEGVDVQADTGQDQDDPEGDPLEVGLLGVGGLEDRQEASDDEEGAGHDGQDGGVHGVLLGVSAETGLGSERATSIFTG